jgi:CheY-like chemotaxis protein/DNA-binding XRE family transcriptional regulator
MSTSQIISRLGSSVRTLRHGLGISQEALAERADLHRTYIADIERGARNVTLKSVEKLASALEVSVAALLVDAGGLAASAERFSGDAAKATCVEILMAEDNREDLKLILRAFRQARISNPLQVVYDGQEALDFLFCMGRFSDRQIINRPQLVLLDLSLPKVSGLDVLRRIKADERTRMIPVVALTNSKSVSIISECLGLGAKTYIVKPVDFQNFASAAQRLGMFWRLLGTPPKL